MKRCILLLLFIMLAGNISAQTLLKTKYNLSEKESYYVLQSDTNIKQGEYKLVTIYDSLLICSGFYKNNLKDSLWSYYSYKTLVETGTYKDDKKIGLWSAYDFRGNLQVKYDYTKKKLIYYVPSARDSDIFKVYNGTEIQMSPLQQPPIYVDGMGVFSRIIAKNIRYPATAKENGIKGTVMISFKIDSNGHTSEFKVLRHIQKDLDNEALRVMKLVPDGWLPGMLNGKPVSVEYMVPVEFALAIY